MEKTNFISGLNCNNSDFEKLFFHVFPVNFIWIILLNLLCKFQMKCNNSIIPIHFSSLLIITGIYPIFKNCIIITKAATSKRKHLHAKQQAGHTQQLYPLIPIDFTYIFIYFHIRAYYLLQYSKLSCKPTMQVNNCQIQLTATM